LTDNKLNDVEKAFLEREIQIEELAEFEEGELADFAKDLGLDTLQRRRFVKAIQDVRRAKSSYGEGGGMSTTGSYPTNTTTTTTSPTTASNYSTLGGSTSYGEPSGNVTSRSGNVHVMMSPPENKAMTKLHQYVDKCNFLLQQLSLSNDALKKSIVDCDTEINEKFDRIAVTIEDKRKQLLRQVDGLRQEKDSKLKEQLNTLLGYQQVIGGGKQQYEAIMGNPQVDINSRKKDVVQVTQGILNRKGINLIMATQPKMQLTFELPVVEKFLKDLEIDDCDQPQPPILTTGKATFNSIAIEWQMSHPSLALKVQDFGIEVAKIRKMEKKSKSSKKSKKKERKT